MDDMPIDPVALGRRVAAHPQWKWARGCSHVSEDGGARTTCTGSGPGEMGSRMYPDLTDPVTLAWVCGPWLESLGVRVVAFRGPFWVYYAEMGGKGGLVQPTRLEALADALDLLEGRVARLEAELAAANETGGPTISAEDFDRLCEPAAPAPDSRLWRIGAERDDAAAKEREAIVAYLEAPLDSDTWQMVRDDIDAGAHLVKP